MKTFFITLFMLLVLTLGAQAQRAVAYGLKGGLTVATIGGKDVDDSDLRAGYHLGAVLVTRLVPGVYLQPELLVSQQGAGKPDNADDKLNLLYLQLPVMAKVMFGKSVNLQFGPYVGVLLNAEVGDADVKDAYKTFDAGLGIGLGYVYESWLTLDARYLYGFSKIWEDEVLGEIDAGNRQVQVSVGFLLNNR